MLTLTKLKPIFVVDDAVGEQYLIKEALKRCEVTNQVFLFGNGQELITTLTTMSSSPRPENLPCLILLDIKMPVMDGWETLEQIKANPKLDGIPVVILTNSSAPEDVDKGHHLGATRYITKSSDMEGLVESMRSLIEFWEGVVESPLDRLDFGAQLVGGKAVPPKAAERLTIHLRTAMSNTSVSIVDIEGTLDINTVDLLESALQGLFEKQRYKIVLNMGKLTYVSSAGFGVLLSVIKDVRRKHGDIKIANVNEGIAKVFDLLELPGLFHILKTVQQAVENF